MVSARTPALPVAVRLDLPQPYDAKSVLDFLAQRALAGIERVGGRTYSRSMQLSGGPATMDLDIGVDSVDVRLRLSDPRDEPAALERCRQLLDLDSDVAAAEAHLAKDPRLAASIEAHPGLRVPGHVDGFEVAVRAVVGQQISVAGCHARSSARLVAPTERAAPGPRSPTSSS